MQASSCIDCNIPPGMQGSVQIYLMQQIAGNTMSPDELMQAAAELNGKIPPGMVPYVIAYLLCAAVTALVA